MRYKTLQQLVKRQNPFWRFLALGLVLALGFTLTISSIAFFKFYRQAFSQNQKAHNEYYLTVSKPASVINSLGLGNSGFSEHSLNTISNQDFVADVGQFISTQFQIVVEVSMENLGKQFPSFQTLLFFESVPKRFVDVDTNAFKWKPGDPVVPVVLPRDYLVLYNYGFATSQGWPQVSENLLKQLTFGLQLRGENRQEKVRARVAGFSDRINTLLVPASFVQWGNAHIGTNKPPSASRLIIELNDPLNEDVYTFFTNAGFDVSRSDAAKSKMARILGFSSLFIWIVGAVICLLGISVLLLGIYLSLASHQQEIRQLFHLGYPIRAISRPYQQLAVLLVLITGLFGLFASMLLMKAILNEVDVQATELNVFSFGLIAGVVLSVCGICVLLWWLLKHRIYRMVWNKA